MKKTKPKFRKKEMVRVPLMRRNYKVIDMAHGGPEGFTGWYYELKGSSYAWHESDLEKV